MKDEEREELIGKLQASTELGRLNIAAIERLFEVMEGIGYPVRKVEKAEPPVKPPETRPLSNVDYKPTIPNAYLEDEH
jgi:hypothetical protein